MRAMKMLSLGPKMFRDRLSGVFRMATDRLIVQLPFFERGKVPESANRAAQSAG
jgi:hypothetical protein